MTSIAKTKLTFSLMMGFTYICNSHILNLTRGEGNSCMFNIVTLWLLCNEGIRKLSIAWLLKKQYTYAAICYEIVVCFKITFSLFYPKNLLWSDKKQSRLVIIINTVYLCNKYKCVVIFHLLSLLFCLLLKFVNLSSTATLILWNQEQTCYIQSVCRHASL